MKYEIKNRWNGAAIWTGDIDPPQGTPTGAMLGIALRAAVKAGADLRRAVLTGADLRRAVLTDADLTDAVLRRADLRRADLTGADLTGADLTDADLHRADLGIEVPTIASIHAAVLAAASPTGALCMATWHTCDTTHCRAGWVTTLAGAAGKALEDKVGTACAAALIYQASDPAMTNVPDFYCSDSEALADMRRLAGLVDAE